MPVFTTEGIIIKRSEFGEADRILTILTPYKGKMKVIAKGVRKITSRRGGNVEMLNKIKFQIFQGKGLPILTEAESINTFSSLKNDLVLSSYGSHVVELAERLLPEDQPNQKVYGLLDQILILLETSPRQIFVRAYEVKILAALGYWSSDQVETTTEIKEALNKLLNFDWPEIADLPVDAKQSVEIERILRYYIEKVLESSLRSIKLIDKLKVKS